jgi:uncharacterized protein YfdQ (DUF2303 family)
MSLNKDTLELIIANAVAAAAAPVTNTPVAALPANVNLHNLEKYQALRSRFRGDMDTHSLSDFANYVTSRSVNTAKGFIDQDYMSCVVFFNLGDEAEPGHADDKATLILKPSAAYKALQQIAGRKLSQKELAEWMEDWRNNLSAEDAEGNTLPNVQAIAAVRNITIRASAERTSVESNFSANRSAMDAIEAASQDTLPAKLHFNIVPFDGLGQRVFTLALSVLTGEEKPALKPRWVGEESQREEIAKEFKTVLNKEVGGHATLLLGNFNAGN